MALIVVLVIDSLTGANQTNLLHNTVYKHSAASLIPRKLTYIQYTSESLLGCP
jgi:hypothetical protein